MVTEGRKMFLSVMTIFLVYAIIFILFDDYDRGRSHPLDDRGDWHLLWFSVAVLSLLGLLLHRYSRRMDLRISREQAEQQNQMRRELTQNIAHELKTPVASILGFTETLLDNPDLPDSMRRQFLERCHAQAHRLTALLQDISMLNRMDYAPDVLSMERVDVSQLVADIIQETHLSLEQRQMTFRNQLPTHIIVCGNPMLLYSIFRNLTDNAIAYAGSGTSITLSATEMEDYWQFRFADDGVGVPPEHLPRLFERFYRVDKGRSRQLGGTGLGLAIVKNAILIHGGTIAAASDHGLAFSFTLGKRKREE